MTDKELKAANLSRDIATWTDSDKHIALNYITTRLATDEADRVDRAKPIVDLSSQDVREITQNRACRVASWKGLDLHVRCDVILKNKGQLLDLLRALKGDA